MKKLFGILACAAALLNIVSCSDGNDTTPQFKLESGSYLHILSTGPSGENKATLTSYNTETEETTYDTFSNVNGQGLGDTAQDIMVYDDKLFITVCGSSVVFVTDLGGKIIAQIKNDDYASPRYLANDGEYVYVTYMDGGVSKINPTNYKIEASAEVSINPEKLVASNGNLYITISKGYYNENACNTIDVYDATTMEYSKSIEVILNPTGIEVDSKGNLYVISMGNYGYGDAPIFQTVQKINIESEQVETLTISGVEGATPAAIVMGANDIMYVIEGVTDPLTWISVSKVYAYDTKSDVVTEFISDDTSISNMYSISTDVNSGEVFVGTSDYTNTGDIYVFNADGTLKSTIEAGINPMEAVSVTIE